MSPKLAETIPYLYHHFHMARLRIPSSDELRGVIEEISAMHGRERRRPNARMPIVFHLYKKAA